MKRTEQGSWCHCSCVWWIPEVHFKDPIAIRPVMGVPGVHKNRFRLKCMFCDTKNGTCFDTNFFAAINSLSLSLARARAVSPFYLSNRTHACCVIRCMHPMLAQELSECFPRHLRFCNKGGAISIQIWLFLFVTPFLTLLLIFSAAPFFYTPYFHHVFVVPGWCNVFDV